MNLAGYIRVSTEGQVDAYGKDVQRNYINEWAAANGHQVTEWFEEDGVSGKTDTAERPALSEILENSNRFEGIVFFDATRIARRLVIQETLLGLIWAAGLTVFTTTAGEIEMDEEDPTRILIRQVLGTLAEFEHRTIVRRLAAGRKVKSSQGGYIGGTPRYGVKVFGIGKTSVFVPDEEEAQAINQIMECRFEGLSLRAIADRMNQFGIPSKTGKRWYASGIQRIIQRFESEHS